MLVVGLPALEEMFRGRGAVKSGLCSVVQDARALLLQREGGAQSVGVRSRAKRTMPPVRKSIVYPRRS